jgi:aspartate carbamoyltransferase regulatory subunit
MFTTDSFLHSSICLLSKVIIFQQCYFEELNNKLLQNIVAFENRLREEEISIGKTPNLSKNHEKEHVSEVKKEKKKIESKDKFYSFSVVKGLYKCEVEGCTNTYRTKENLRLHYKNIHLKMKPYKCSYCELQFSHRNGNYNIIYNI